MGGDQGRLARRQGAVFDNVVLEGASGRVLHGHAIRPVRRTPPIVDDDYVRVVEGRGAPRLAPEALNEVHVVGILLLKDLEGDVPLKDLVARQEDLGHASAAQGLAQTVVTVAYKNLLHSEVSPLQLLLTATNFLYTSGG